MNSLINDFRLITLSCFILLGLLTQSASGNELKYVLEFNKDSNLDDLHFTVLTDEDALAQVPAQASNFFEPPTPENGEKMFMTLVSGQARAAIIYYPSNLEQGTKDITEYATYTQTSVTNATGTTSLPTLSGIQWSRQVGQPDLPTEPINRVLLTDFPTIDLSGHHARALGFERVWFDSYLNSVAYEGNDHYSANFSAMTTGPHSIITIPVQIRLNNEGMLVAMTFEYNSVRFVLRLQEYREYETPELEMRFENEDDDPSPENQTLSRGNEARQQPDLNDDEYVSPLLPATPFSSKF